MYKYKLLKNDVLLLLYNEIISSGNCCQHYYNIDDEVISILKSLTYEEVVHLCEHPCPLVNFQVNSVTLKAQLNRLNEERKRREIIGRAVEMKASRKLLAEYYGIGQEELQQMRAKLEVDIKRGRVQKIDENISRCIWDVFSMLPQEKQDISKTECFEEMVKLAEKYGVSVMAVYDSLTEGLLAQSMGGKRSADLSV